MTHPKIIVVLLLICGGTVTAVGQRLPDLKSELATPDSLQRLLLADSFRLEKKQIDYFFRLRDDFYAQSNQLNEDQHLKSGTKEKSLLKLRKQHLTEVKALFGAKKYAAYAAFVQRRLERRNMPGLPLTGDY